MTDEDVRMTGADVDLHSGGESGVQRAGDRDQLIARHGQEAFVAAERDRVQFGDDDDVFFRLILVLQGNAGVLWRMRDVRNGRRAFRRGTSLFLSRRCRDLKVAEEFGLAQLNWVISLWIWVVDRERFLHLDDLAMVLGCGGRDGYKKGVRLTWTDGWVQENAREKESTC